MNAGLRKGDNSKTESMEWWKEHYFFCVKIGFRDVANLSEKRE